MSSAPVDRELAGLFGRVWPALPRAIARAEHLGFAWTAVSTPFVRREGDRVVGHAGVIELSLVMAGRVRRIGSATRCAPIPSDGGGAWAARSWKTS
jgi:hypothetical protein